MNTVARRIGRLTLLCTVLLAGAGCAGYGNWEDVLGGVLTPGMGGDITGEVRQVDTRRQRIELVTHEGRREVVDYDRRTRVVYRRQEYPVSALERGDEVSLRVRQGTRGELYTDYVHVRRSVSDRGGSGGYEDYGGSARVERLEGRVEYVSRDRGQFSVRDRYGREVLVSLPYRARSRDVDRFRRLRRGEQVRVEVERLNERRAELVRFR